MNYCVTAFTKDSKPLRKGCEGDTQKISTISYLCFKGL